MKMLEDEQYEYDFLVTLDSDMLMIKPGFSEFLDLTMAESKYMGPNFQEIMKGTDGSSAGVFYISGQRNSSTFLK